MGTDLSVVGAAMSVVSLPQHRDWLLEKQRDLELQDYVFASVLNSDWQPFVDMALKQLDGYQGRLGIHGPYSDFQIDARDPEIAEFVRKRMDQALDVCAALGAVQMVIHSPYTTWDHNNLDLKPKSRARKIEATHKCLSAAVKRAEDQGVTLVIENIEDVDPRDRQVLAASFDSDYVKVSVDTGHAYYAHGVTGAPVVDRFIQYAGDQLGHIHLQDTDGYADRHWGLGEGSVLWPSVFRAIAELPVKPHLILELNDPDDIAKSMAYLEDLGLAQ